MSDGLLTFAEAAAEAITETGFGEPVAPEVEVETATPVEPTEILEEVVADDGQADATDAEHPEVLEPELFDDELIDEVVPEAPEATAPLGDDTVIDVPALQESVTLKELREGYMRQADYTRKTQELSTQRGEASDAVKFWDALQENPLPIVKSLAARVGLIASEDAEPVGEGDVSPLKSEAAIQAEVEKRVEAELANHPDVVEAKRMKAIQVVDAEFDRIAKENDVTIGPKSRQAILSEAQRTGAADLEMVFHALVARQNKRTNAVSDLQAVSPTRTRQGMPDTPKVAPEGEVLDFKAASAKALAELGAS